MSQLMVSISRKLLILKVIHLVLFTFSRFDKYAPLVKEASAAKMSQRVS